MWEAIITGLIVGVLVFGFQMTANWLTRKINKKRDVNKDLKVGVQALLMDRLEEKGEQLIKKKYADHREKNLFDKEYQAYHNLGENGVMTSTYEKVMELPTERPTRHTVSRTISD